MQTDEKTFVVDSVAAITAFGKWVRAQFALHPYLVFTMMDGLSRTLLQNSKLWPMLTDIAKQVTWYGKKYDKDAWKDILTGSFKSAEFVPNTEGSGFVVLGMRTSKMRRKEFAALIQFIYAFGDTQGVKWSEQSESVYQEYKEAA